MTNRRNFIRTGAGVLSAASFGGLLPGILDEDTQRGVLRGMNPTKKFIPDAGIKMCFAYFRGIEAEKQKVEFGKQLNVLGAVGGINPSMIGMKNVNPWDYEVVLGVKTAWEKAGLNLEVIEGPPALGEKTKLGLPGRDEEISNFITLMKNLSRVGINTICYNWMPVISWARTTTDRPGRGGALVTAFDAENIRDKSLTAYGEITKEALWDNLEYFLKAVIPEADRAGIFLAMHPDDPQVDSIRGISRIMTTANAFRRMYQIYPKRNNGITMCQGNFSLMGEDIPSLIREFGKKGIIHFVHFRNVRGSKFNFVETFHDEGQIDMYEAMKAYIDTGFKGPLRPDHVPTMAGDSNANPGYSALGSLYAAGYIRGLIEAIAKNN
ncbi:MAG TPA: mannonate dehydratase [Bacteroidales bacterium]|jgi:mannonate dehydratase|nr:mannonate dehydratase [Bacteroidales bacterium]